jgi:nucleoside phosphorylase
MDILVVAATPFELAWVGSSARVLACGIGPVEAAAATAASLVAHRPDAVLHVGIAGARRSADVPLRSVVIGLRSTYSDIAAAIPVERVLAPAPAMLAAARAALPEAQVLEIATSAGVGRSTGAPIEAMEGFGVLRAAALAGVPAIEVRVVSNVVEERDRSRWDIPGALAALAPTGAAVLRQLLAAPA